MFSKPATDNRYGSVDDVIARYDQGLISRQSLHQLRWRFKKEGKQDRVDGGATNLLIVFYVQIMTDDFVMQFHRF